MTKSVVRSKTGCEEAVGQGVSSSPSGARLVAQASLTSQAQDLRGFMLKEGYGRVVRHTPRVECHPYPLGFGLTQCVAKAQLCGY